MIICYISCFATQNLLSITLHLLLPLHLRSLLHHMPRKRHTSKIKTLNPYPAPHAARRQPLSSACQHPVFLFLRAFTSRVAQGRCHVALVASSCDLSSLQVYQP